MLDPLLFNIFLADLFIIVITLILQIMQMTARHMLLSIT